MDDKKPKYDEQESKDEFWDSLKEPIAQYIPSDKIDIDSTSQLNKQESTSNAIKPSKLSSTKKVKSRKLDDNSTDGAKLNFVIDLMRRIESNDSLNSRAKKKLLKKAKNLSQAHLNLSDRLVEVPPKAKADYSEMSAVDKEIFRLNGEYKELYLEAIAGQEHNPRLFADIMKNFSKEHPLKYSTHIWDTGYQSYYEFVEDLIRKKNTDVQSISNINSLNRDFYQSVIYDFLFRDMPKNDKYEWGQHKLKIGWQYPPEMVELYKEAGKFPQAVRIPEDLRERRYIPGHGTLGTLEDYINVFKKELEFRGQDLMEAVLSPFKSSSEFNILEEDINSLRDVTDFYSSTSNVNGAFAIIYNNFSSPNRKKYRNIKIETQYIENDTKVVLSITQIGSFADREVKDRKIIIRDKNTQLGKMRNNLISLCDLSVESRFRLNGSSAYLRLNYLNRDEQFIEILDENEVTGFTYKFTFYV